MEQLMRKIYTLVNNLLIANLHVLDREWPSAHESDVDVDNILEHPVHTVPPWSSSAQIQERHT